MSGTQATILNTNLGALALRRQVPASYVVSFDGTNYRADSMVGGADALPAPELGAVLQTAATALSSGGEIVFHEGTFNISTRVKLGNGIKLRGMGKDVTIIRQANNSNLNYLIANAGNPQDGSSTVNTNISLMDLTLDYNGANNTTPPGGAFIGGTNLFMNGFTDLNATRVAFKNAHQFNAFLQATNALRSGRAKLFQCEFIGALGGFDSLGGGTSEIAQQYLTNIDVLDCTFRANTGAGLGIQGVGAIDCSHNLFTGNNTNPSTSPPYDLGITDAVGVIVHKNRVLDQAGGLATVEPIQVSTVNSTVSTDVMISGNLVRTGFKCIHAKNCQELVITKNTCRDASSSGFGIIQDGANSTQAQIEGNFLFNNPTAISYVNARVRNNGGYVTENSGTATVSASTSVVVNHGLAATPGIVNISAGTTGTGVYYVDTITSSQFTIHVANSGTYTFYWYASVT